MKNAFKKYLIEFRTKVEENEALALSEFSIYPDKAKFKQQVLREVSMTVLKLSRQVNSRKMHEYRKYNNHSVASDHMEYKEND